MEKKKADLCREFVLVNSTMQIIWENRTKLVREFEQNGLRISDCVSLYEVTSTKRCLSALSNREVTMYCTSDQSSHGRSRRI
jgi:hypothetical protein